MHALLIAMMATTAVMAIVATIGALIPWCRLQICFKQAKKWQEAGDA